MTKSHPKVWKTSISLQRTYKQKQYCQRYHIWSNKNITTSVDKYNSCLLFVVVVVVRCYVVVVLIITLADNSWSETQTSKKKLTSL